MALETNCLIFGKLFEKVHFNEKYCSGECRIQAKNETARVQIRDRELERIRRESKKKAKENQKIIVSIAVEARKHGMSYGQYVALHNL